AGDLSDFECQLNWVGDCGGHVAATLPLLAAFLDEPFEPSPYAPASRLFWNEFYVDLGEAGRPIRSKFVDYRSEMQRRRKVLEKRAETFFSGGPTEDHERFAAFVTGQNELEEYARFRAVAEKQQSGWRSWPSGLRDGVIRPGDYDPRVARYHLYAQW